MIKCDCMENQGPESQGEKNRVVLDKKQIHQNLGNERVYLRNFQKTESTNPNKNRDLYIDKDLQSEAKTHLL